MLKLWVTYLPPREDHENLIQILIEKITRIKIFYENNLILKEMKLKKKIRK